MRHYLTVASCCLLTGLVVAHSEFAQTLQDSGQHSETKIKVQSVLVNEPVSVRDPKGEMVNSLEAKDFRITDNGVEQTITHFDLGGDAISLVVLAETSSRIDSVLSDLRKTGILLSQAVMSPNDEAAVVGFNNSVDTLQIFYG